MFNWFSENNFQANPDKSQFIFFTNDVLYNTVNIANIILNKFYLSMNVLPHSQLQHTPHRKCNCKCI